MLKAVFFFADTNAVKYEAVSLCSRYRFLILKVASQYVVKSLAI